MKKIRRFRTYALALLLLLLSAWSTNGDFKAVANDSSNSSLPQEREKLSPGGAISDDIYSFSIMLDGELFTLPIEYNTLIEAGWELPETYEDDKIAPKQATNGIGMKKNGKSVMVVFSNITSTDSIPLNQCYVIEVRVDTQNFNKSPAMSYVLPGGLDNKATRDDLIKAHGEPTESYIRSGKTYDTFEITYTRSNQFVSDENGNILSIDILNETDIYDANGEVVKTGGVLIGKVPDEIRNYKRPATLNKNIWEYTFSVKNGIYQLPAPISVFLEDGWVLVESPKTLMSKEFYYGASIMKENKKLQINLVNYSDYEQNTENTWVTSVAPDGMRFREGSIEITIGNGIKNGMSTSEFKELTKDLNVEKDEYNDYIVYTIKEDLINYYEFSISKKLDVITHIKISKEPKELD